MLRYITGYGYPLIYTGCSLNETTNERRVTIGGSVFSVRRTKVNLKVSLTANNR